MFNWLDYVILGVIGFSTLISIARGFFREALSLATWIVSLWISVHFARNMSLFLEPYLHQNGLRIIASFGILFILTLIAGSMISFIIGRLVNRAGLGGFDRMLGILFGLGRGIVFVAALLLVAQVIIPATDPLWTRSLLTPYFKPIEMGLISFLPNDMRMQFQRATSVTRQAAQAQATFSSIQN